MQDNYHQENLNSNDQQQLPKYSQDQLSQNIRIYVTLKKSLQDDGETSKKLIIMTPLNQKISMLKRLVEQEYADLFPNEPTFICAKLQDQYGYSLSNSSYVYELLKNHDRLFAIPEGLQGEIGQAGQAMHLTSDTQELLFLLRSIQSNIAAKLTESNFNRVQNIDEVLVQVIPMGFNVQSKMVVHNVSQAIRKILETERLYIFENQNNHVLFNLLITLINFWSGDLIFQDSVILSATIDILDILIKSAIVSHRLKSPLIINNLMNASKLEMASAQTRSRIIRIISYLTKGEFQDLYNPRPVSRGQRIELRDIPSQYQPSSLDQNKRTRPSSIRDLNQQPPPIINNNNNVDIRYNSKNQPIQQPNQYLNQQPQNLQNNQFNNNSYEVQQQNQQFYAKNNNPANNIQSMSQERFRQNQESSNNIKYQDQQQQPQNQILYNQNIQQDQQINKNFKQKKAEQYSSSNIDPHSNIQQQMMRDYVSLLVPESTQDMHIFAVQNLDPVIDQIINFIMENKESYLRLLSLLEIPFNQENQLSQLKILDCIGKNMNTQRAVDGLQNKVVQRILRAFTFQPSSFQQVLYDLLTSHLKYGDFQVDVPTAVALIECPYENLQMLGIKVLTVISDPNKTKYQNYDVQFENYIKQLIDYTFDRQKTHEFVNQVLFTLANLALKDNLRSQMIYNRAIEMFLAHLRNDNNVEGQRISAKSLLNLSISSRENKMKIVGELSEEIKKMHRSQIDSIVHGYLQTLLISKDNAKNF